MTARGCSGLSHGLGFWVQQTRLGHREKIMKSFGGGGMEGMNSNTPFRTAAGPARGPILLSITCVWGEGEREGKREQEREREREGARAEMGFEELEQV